MLLSREFGLKPDIVYFKKDNDTLGHNIGGQLLLTLADRMRALVGDLGYVARQGGG
ncbi:MAG: diguanylate cyclase domain-containing protein [Marinomonas sp.]